MVAIDELICPEIIPDGSLRMILDTVDYSLSSGYVDLSIYVAMVIENENRLRQKIKCKHGNSEGIKNN